MADNVIHMLAVSESGNTAPIAYCGQQNWLLMFSESWTGKLRAITCPECLARIADPEHKRRPVPGQ
jgi:hypothetical protein